MKKRKPKRVNESIGYIEIPAASFFIKECADIVIASLALVLTFPLIILISMLIKMQSPGPVFFRQKRIGKHGVPFMIYKFRSMIQNAEAVLKGNPELLAKHRTNFKLDASDPRITPGGRILRKTSLDELPQLFNVLKGEMSIVGPRPLVPDEIRQYYFGLEWKLLAVKPGITGYWQSHGRSAIAYPERIDFELYYPEHFSLWLDIKIILKTVRAVMFRLGAF